MQTSANQATLGDVERGGGVEMKEQTFSLDTLPTGLVILLYKLEGQAGAEGSEKGSRRVVPVR